MNLRHVMHAAVIATGILCLGTSSAQAGIQVVFSSQGDSRHYRPHRPYYGGGYHHRSYSRPQTTQLVWVAPQPPVYQVSPSHQPLPQREIERIRNSYDQGYQEGYDQGYSDGRCSRR